MRLIWLTHFIYNEHYFLCRLNWLHVQEVCFVMQSSHVVFNVNNEISDFIKTSLASKIQFGVFPVNQHLQ